MQLVLASTVIRDAMCVRAIDAPHGQHPVAVGRSNVNGFTGEITQLLSER